MVSLGDVRRSAATLFSQGQHLAALRLYDAIVTAAPLDYDARIRLADCALAAGNRRLFESFVRLVRSRFRAAAGIETHNLGLMLERFREWGVSPDYIVAPVNASALGMKPSSSESLAALRGTTIPVLAKELCAGGAAFEDGAAFAREQGARGLVADVCELEDAGFELKAVG